MSDCELPPTEDAEGGITYYSTEAFLEYLEHPDAQRVVAEKASTSARLTAVTNEPPERCHNCGATPEFLSWDPTLGWCCDRCHATDADETG